jgi:FAD/FMN-containing dehydrogenase
MTEVEMVRLPGLDREVATVFSEAGVVTQRVADAAERAGHVFAVDPTSAEASCIGGNIAMNAGGKKAVLWGTALDNLASWRMVTPEAKWLEVVRLDHNLGKIHDVELASSSCATSTPAARSWSAPSGWTSRAACSARKGLGKDVTDKFLAGLPGIQKEGCDGLITSAAGSCTACRRTCAPCAWSSSATRRTRCRPSSRSRTTLFARPRAAAILAGLEHLDDRYLKAVGYATKSKRGGSGLPKMVLVGDIVGDDEAEVARATSEVVRIANARSGEGFVAVSADARKKFWLDRKRTAAIAATPTPSRSTRTW